MTWRGGYIRRTALVLSLMAVAGCTAVYRDHGYVPSDADLQDVIVGVDDRDSVAGTLGRPSAAGILDETGYYYVASRRRHFAWRAPEEVNREVVAISFDRAGVVANVERFGLERGRVVALSRRITDENVRPPGLINQLFRNIGRLRAEDLLN